MLIWDPIQRYSDKTVRQNRALKTQLKDFCSDENIPRCTVLIMEDCIPKNNYQACGSPGGEGVLPAGMLLRSQMQTSRVVAICCCRKKRGEKWSGFIFPSITSGPHNHLTLATAPPASAKDFKHNFRKPSFLANQQAILSKGTHAHTCTRAHTHNNLHSTKGNCSVSALKGKKTSLTRAKTRMQNESYWTATSKGTSFFLHHWSLVFSGGCCLFVVVVFSGLMLRTSMLEKNYDYYIKSGSEKRSVPIWMTHRSWSI